MVQAGGASSKLRTNTSTDDLLSLDSGTRTPERPTQQQQATTSGQPSSSGAAAGAHDGSGITAAPASPTPTRAPMSTLKLDIDNTWSTGETQKSTKGNRFTQNLKAGAAKVSAVVQKGASTQTHFRFVLVLLFGSIIGLVTFTWLLYHHKQQMLAVGEGLRIHEKQRVVYVQDPEGREVLRGNIGLGIPERLSSIDCHVLEGEHPSEVCMEWKFRARFKVRRERGANHSCYHVQWAALQDDTVLKDCYSMDGVNWYGMGEVRNLTWPLGKMSIPSRPFITGDVRRGDAFGAVLDRFWISSVGVTITVPLEVPLHVSVNEGGDQRLCLEARFDAFPYHKTPNHTAPFLHYSLCSGRDMRSIHAATIKMANVLPSSLNESKLFCKDPVWSTQNALVPAHNQSALKAHADHIVDHGFGAGVIVVDHRWQQHEGDLRFHREDFPTPPSLLQILKNKGFKVLLGAHPYAACDSDTFANLSRARDALLMTDQYLGVPLLTRWQGQPSGIVDLTKEEASRWFLERLRQLQAAFNVDGFLFRGGHSTLLPLNYRLGDVHTNPDVYMKHYLAAAARLGPWIGVSGGVRATRIPAFVQLSPRTSTWDALSGIKSVLPTVLTLSLLGYPIVNAGSIGGDGVPGKELYMRWLQLAVFLPVLQFSVPPGKYDIDVAKAARVLFKIRKERVLAILEHSLQEFLEEGTPVVRPMWWLAPEDPSTQLIATQFAIGNEIVVAPVLDEGVRSRDVYLPPGWWRDEQGQIRKGGKSIHNYSVPLDKVAYFTREQQQN